MSNKEEINLNNIASIPVLALRGLVVFPDMVLQFDVGRKRSIAALDEAMQKDQKIFLVAQKDLSDNEPVGDQLYTVGVVAKIKQVLHHTEDGVRLYIEGLYRAKINKILADNPFIIAEVEALKTSAARTTHRTEALLRHAQNLFEQYIQNYKRVPPDIILGVIQKKNCGELADFITENITLDFDQKQIILEELHPVKRLQKLIAMLEDEIQIMEIENEIHQKTKESIDKNQRDYYLREQMHVISEELGEEDNPQEEADEFRARILALKLPPLQEEKLLKECDRFYKMPFGSHEASVIRNYIETCLELPWNTSSKEKINLKHAQKVLDRDHYGLTKIKDRLIETLAVRKLTQKNSGQILCLVGPPGVGKTSIAKSIAEAIGRKYVRVSLGGVRDESDIIGHRKTYIGSMPGRIIAAVKQAGVKNPLILLDEIDKLQKDYKGDPASALLEVLDSEQNVAFYDHYIDMPFDLSSVLFLATANDYSSIPEPLLDRMDVITLSSYTHEEKYQIATRHLIPKQLKKHGMTKEMLKITPSAVHIIIEQYTKEAGVRNLERTIASICRKCARKFIEDPTLKISVKPQDLESLLGPAKFRKEDTETSDLIGLVNGLAWTSVGGEMLPIEAAVMPGTGKIELTGSLGNVMKESAKIALTCIRTRASSLGISDDFYSKTDFHIHAPEGAVPKDGPSAGIAMASALTSALCNIPCNHTVAMTGEITLQGRVLPIGGLKEKTMAAYRAGIRTVLIPADNIPDLEEIEPVVKQAIHFIPVKKLDEVLPQILVYMPRPNSEKTSDGTNLLMPGTHTTQTAHIAQ